MATATEMYRNDIAFGSVMGDRPRWLVSFAGWVFAICLGLSDNHLGVIVDLGVCDDSGCG